MRYRFVRFQYTDSMVLLMSAHIMRSLFLLLSLLGSVRAFPFEINVVEHKKLELSAKDLLQLNRAGTQFTSVPVEAKLKNKIISVIKNTVQLLPPRYLPHDLEIALERTAVVTSPDEFNEEIPLSLFLTTQVPLKNQIRFSDYEIQNDDEAIRTILSHETGHMLIEWALHAEKILRTDQTAHVIWSGAIYEGVADYVSATVNNSSHIMGTSKWYSRDISRFKTITEAKNFNENSLQIVEDGLKSENFIPRYKTYTKMIAALKIDLEGVANFSDPYIVGTWLAGQLWNLNKTYGSKKVFATVLAVTISGKKFKDADIFFSEIESQLKQKKI